MVKCPICGLDVSPEEYVAHYDSHGVGVRVEGEEKLVIYFKLWEGELKHGTLTIS